MPNKALQQTGHANDGFARHYGVSRVSRLLSLLFGEGESRSADGASAMSWRAGAHLFREMWPLIQRHISEDVFRAEFVRDLLALFQDCDMDGTDLRRFHPEIEKALDELGVGEG